MSIVIMASLISASLLYCDVDYSTGQYERLPGMTGVAMVSLSCASRYCVVDYSTGQYCDVD